MKFAGGKGWLSGLSIGLLIMFVALYFIWPDYRVFLQEMWLSLTSGDRQQVRLWVEKAGLFGPLLIILLMTLQMFTFVIPSWLLMIVAVIAYGPWWGGLLSIVSVSIAGAVGYGIGLLVGQKALARVIGREAERRVIAETNRYGIWAVFMARLNPFLSNDLVSFVAGVLRMGFPRFMTATLAGIAPLAVMIGYFGREDSQMKWGLLVISLVSLAGLVVKIWFDRRPVREVRDHAEG